MCDSYLNIAKIGANEKMESKPSSNPRSSSRCDLQSFYENFDPDSTEDCMFAMSCVQTEGIHHWNERCSAKTQYNISDRNSQITPEPEPVDNYCNQYGNGAFSKTIQGNKDTKCNQIKRMILKKKRKRTMFTTEQIVAMEQIFKVRPYICRDDRINLMQKIRVGENAIKVWFQNRRRMSEKRDKTDLPDSPSSLETCNSDRLMYIEGLISERVDELGNVTLDEQLIAELVNVIDEYLPDIDTIELFKDVSCDLDNTQTSYDETSLMPQTSDQNNIIMYEPISPISVIDEFLQ
ncbi:unnamed protein product [Leptosia nina]|uniref:Homeobox domain-containing protein n=1 Tax=Leptosia nina TaxID=320188 RepID=A0AAV1J7M4_9NEOP